MSTAQPKIEPEQIDYTERLREWVLTYPGTFEMIDVLEFLGINPDSDGAWYAIPSIAKALESLGCKKEIIVIYRPPAKAATVSAEILQEWVADDPSLTIDEAQEFIENHQHLKDVAISPASPIIKRADDKQIIINTIRNWVFSQEKPFTIADIYSDPPISEKLACTLPNMHLIDQALCTLRCTTEQDHNNTPLNELRYIPPVIRHVSRDEIYT